MLRSLTSRLVALALITPTALLASAGAPVSAAEGDVLTVEWHTQLTSGTLATQTADFTAYPPSSTTAPGGAVFGVSTKKVTLAPPKDSRFEPGTTYSAAKDATTTTARLVVGGVWSTTLCPTSTVASTVASIRVRQAGYDANGVLTRLAADYRATCTLSSGAEETVAGSVRHGSTTPWLALRTSYDKDIVALGHQRTRPVTVTAVAAGKTVTLGGASFSGVRAADYSVAANGCAGKVLGDGDSCQVDVTFEPQETGDGTPKERRASLFLDTTGHVADQVRVRLDSRSTEIPGAPLTLTTYPTANGVGVTWDDGWPTAAGYRLERRLGGESAWTELADLPNGSPYNFVDHDVAPGQDVAYRVTGHNADWDGPSATTATTRPASVPTAGSHNLVAFATADATGGDATVVDGVDGGTVYALGGQRPRVQATAGPTGTAMAPSEATFYVPMVPGPGEYRSADSMSGWVGASVAPNLNCTYADSVLDVRSVAYDEDRKPLVFDGSWVGRCEDDTVSRVEIRLGVDTGHNRITTDPVVVGRLTTYAGSSDNGTATVTNQGPEAVTLGDATIRGQAAGDWSVTGSTCTGAVLAAGDSCAVEVRFSSTADHERPAVLEVDQHDADGDLAPVYVPLDGYGATPPAAPDTYGNGTVGAILLWWHPNDDGGMPILSYDVQRRPSGTTTWSAVASVPADEGENFAGFADQGVTDTLDYDYRIRGVNAVGRGTWSGPRLQGLVTRTRAVVVSGSKDATGPRGLFQVHGGDSQWQAPVIPLTDDPQHDFRDPAVSPAGTRLAVSVSTGDGSDGEYDLWSGTLDDPQARRLTTMPGAERDASYSPDASTVAFTHVAADGSRSVWVVPALGGEATKVRDAAAAPAWTADGTGLVVEDDSAADAPLLRVDLADGSAAPLPGTVGGSEPAVSRAGAVAFVDDQGRILELAPGASTATVKVYPRSGRTLGDPVYDDTGRVFTSVFWRDTGDPDWNLTYRLQVSGEPAPVLQDRQAPWVTPAGLTDYVRGSATFTPRFGDNGETPEPALRPTCRLDDAAWEPCTGETTYPDLVEGDHLLRMRLTDEAGHTARRRVRFVSDTVAPTFRLKAPRLREVLRGRASFTWNGFDQASGADWYDIKIRVATPTSDFTRYRLPRGWSGPEQVNEVTQRVAVGEELCLRGRVRDLSGLWSRYVERCVGRPVDDRALDASAAWRRTKGSGLYRGTETVATRKGATLRTGRVTVRRIGVLATTCPDCGAVKVYAGRRYLGTVSLRSDRTRNRRLLSLPVLPREVTRRVVLRTASGRLVRIDGLLLRRT